jgi:magnesium chelatase family protein
VSGPLLDRFDLVVKVDRLELPEPRDAGPESTAEVRGRVAQARQRLNDQRPALLAEGRGLLDSALRNGLLTARGVDRVTRVATTICALTNGDQVAEEHVAEAMGLRADW